MTMAVIFTVRFRAPAGQPGIRALRRALKFAGRYCGLRCIDVVEQHETPPIVTRDLSN